MVEIRLSLYQKTISKLSVSALKWSANDENSLIFLNFYTKNFSFCFRLISKTPGLYLTNHPGVETGIRTSDKLSVVHYTTNEVLIKHNTASDGHASYST